MGFQLDGQALNTAFKRFKEIADRKKQLTAMDLEALSPMSCVAARTSAGMRFSGSRSQDSSRRPPHARVAVTLPEGGTGEGSFTGDGPIDAVFRAINAAAGVDAKLGEFTIGAVTEGQDALGEVSVVVEVDGMSGRRPGCLD